MFNGTHAKGKWYVKWYPCQGRMLCCAVDLQETRAAYEAMMNTVHAIFGDQPADVLRGAADEVLAVLKDQNKTGTLDACRACCEQRMPHHSAWPVPCLCYWALMADSSPSLSPSRLVRQPGGRMGAACMFPTAPLRMSDVWSCIFVSIPAHTHTSCRHSCHLYTLQILSASASVRSCWAP